MLESAGKLIAEITNATNSLKGLEISDKNIDLKQKTLDLKEFEINNKIEAKKNSDTKNITNNVIITDRENLLKMLNNQTEEIEE